MMMSRHHELSYIFLCIRIDQEVTESKVLCNSFTKHKQILRPALTTHFKPFLSYFGVSENVFCPRTGRIFERSKCQGYFELEVEKGDNNIAS
jgi:hypothetical protein